MTNWPRAARNPRTCGSSCSSYAHLPREAPAEAQLPVLAGSSASGHRKSRLRSDEWPPRFETGPPGGPRRRLVSGDGGSEPRVLGEVRLRVGGSARQEAGGMDGRRGRSEEEPRREDRSGGRTRFRRRVPFSAPDPRL
uniref:Uncharacterized protein n=1 Tax=Pipistrellus kuhlii TaxID=59472 RepID=A0A7J7TP08_PIPKU|nr:hypothetical protein mPipKuh1_009289 [Pipistrellus kuhlii]